MNALLLAALLLAAGDPPLRVSSDITAPVVIKRVEPKFPRMPKGAKRPAALIVVEGVITKQGSIRDPKVIKGADDPYAPYVLAAVRQWKFRPATQKGKPIEVTYQVTTRIDVF